MYYAIYVCDLQNLMKDCQLWVLIFTKILRCFNYHTDEIQVFFKSQRSLFFKHYDRLPYVCVWAAISVNKLRNLHLPSLYLYFPHITCLNWSPLYQVCWSREPWLYVFVCQFHPSRAWGPCSWLGCALNNALHSSCTG